jgi:hypothetical protein
MTTTCQHATETLLRKCPYCDVTCSETQIGDDQLCYDERCPLHAMEGSGREIQLRTIELQTPNGPRVEYGPDDDAHDVAAAARAAGFEVDFSNQIKLASGRYRAPLVLPAEPKP